MRQNSTISRREVIVGSGVGAGLIATGVAAAAVVEANQVPSTRVSGADVTAQLQRALDHIPKGGAGRIVIEPGVHRITRSVTAAEKTVYFELQGTLKDAVTTWRGDVISKRLDDKGLLAFRSCSVSLKGIGAGPHLDGSAGEPGLSQDARALLFFDRCRLDLQQLWTKNSTGATIQAFSTRRAVYRDCRHDRAGQYGVFFLGGRDITIERVRIRGSFNGALSVNRTGYGLTANRPQRVQIIDCDVRGYSAKNSYAGGIVVNDGDDVRATGNVSDGRGRASFAYSFAGCSNVYSRNTALNMSNNRVGTYDYAGIAFELDGVADGDFDDQMVECLGGYLLANNKRVRLAGTYRCNAGRRKRLDSGAGKTGMFMIANTRRKSSDITVVGARCDGGNAFMTGAMTVDGLLVTDTEIKDTFYSVFNFEAGVVRRLRIEDLVYLSPGAVPAPVIQAGDGVLRGISVIRAQASTSLPGSGVFFAASMSNQSMRFDSLDIAKLGVGIDLRGSRPASITIKDSRFRGVARPVMGLAARSGLALQGNTWNGKRFTGS